MTATEANRTLIEGIFAELARDNPLPFRDALADDVCWTTRGSSVWSRSFVGKATVLNELLGTVRTQLVARVRLGVRRILADGDHVVVEATGQATTKTGQPYNNEYCFVYRIAGGKVVEVIEYLDTQLACAVLAAPWAPAVAATSQESPA
jgi:ketosteroid isomerase-like protein